MKITSKILRVDHATLNGGRLYPRRVIEAALKEFQERVSQNQVFGSLDFPEGGTLDVARISHRLTDVRMEGDYVVATAQVLNTPLGNVAKAIISKYAIEKGALADDLEGVIDVNDSLITLAAAGTGKVENGVVADYKFLSAHLITKATLAFD